MRIVLTGAGEISITTAQELIREGHEVIIIESNGDKIEGLSEELDCSFLHGDAGKPAVLREVSPEQTDFLFCLTDNDQANIIASLVGRSLGFKRVVTSIQDSEFEGICRELGLSDTIIPGRTISRQLVDMVKGMGAVELSTILKAEARFFTFTVTPQDATAVAELGLPDQARAICYYRDGHFAFIDNETRLHQGDEVVILTHSQNLVTLTERWEPQQTNHARASAKEDR